jgi:acyl transferase domain-containing protein/acyl carrier protein
MASLSDRVSEESPRGSPPRVDVLKKWLRRELARVLDVSEQAIAINEAFSRFGLDSAKAIGLLRGLSEFLGREVPVTLAWSHPTIEKLSNYLCGNPELKSEVLPRHSAALAVWNQPIAVIGLACRFPGAPDPAVFWELLRSGRSAIREITPDRWDIGAWYDPDPHKPGKMNARRGGLLEMIDHFDPGFFGIAPREAIQMDPQQRLALELAWEALEDAGIRPGNLRGSPTGVFVGVMWHDYETLARKAGEEITLHTGTGQAFSIVANRISYWLGLHGPSIAVDTACSSSLVSVHLACRSLQSGDATLAIAGGVNLIMDPETTVALSKFGGLSGTSQSRAFDSHANGYVRGEGGGLVVLKSLTRALADGDPIYAVIRGTAVNNDGASNGLTAPNPHAQELVLQRAVAGAGIRTSDVHYVEAHGTGTQLGDPIEAGALGNVLGRDRTEEQPLLIGSVKTNIGHLEGAAGIAGLIKLVLSVNHRLIPPSLNFESPNPHIDFKKANLRVVTTLERWPEPAKPAVGGVSSFGWGGTNCHVIVEEVIRSKAHLLPLAAPDRDTLNVIAAELKKCLNARSSTLSLADVCATAAARCAPHPERLALTVRSVDELDEQLEAFLQGQKHPGIAVGHRVSQRPKLAFIFSPQGSQWIGMGKSLIASEPAFRAKLAECDRSLTNLTGWSLFDLLLAAPDQRRLDGVEFIQPALTAIQVALVELWNSWGVRPDYVATHCIGEWAGAFAAGALNVEETMRIAVEASRAQSYASPDGGMAIVELPEQEVIGRIQEWAGEIFVGGQNSPTSTMLSGNAGCLKSLIARWKNEGLTCSIIDIDVATHSPCMNGVLERLKASLGGVHPRRMAIPLVSSATGAPIPDADLGTEHWARNLQQPALFTQVTKRLAKEGCTVFVEMSPHPILISGIRQTLSSLGVDGVTLASCWRGADERESLLTSLGTLYTLGWAIDWDAVAQGGRKDLDLPISASEAPAGTSFESSEEAPRLLPLSGHTATALQDRARSIAQHLRTRAETSLDDFVYTLGVARQPLEHRLAIVGIDREKLASTLDEFARTENFFDLNLIKGRTDPNAVPRVAFVCSGQGPQWQGMGRELMASIPAFRQEIVRCADEIKRHVSWDLLEELERDEAGSRLQETQIAQPALFALQVALAAVWRSWGIVPDVLIGHSAGEVAAAYLSGALSFEAAVTVICRRGRLMQRATGLGKMAALEITEAGAEDLLCIYRDRISLAAVNSPTSMVVSGETDAIEQLVETVASQGVRAKVLPVDYAFHSPQMEPFRLEMAQAISALKSDLPSIAVYSSVTGAQATADDFGSDYWGRNIRQTVRFATAVNAMLAAGTDIFVELSPHPVLSGMIAQCAEAASKGAQQLPSLRHGVSESLQMFRSLGALFAAGRDVDWWGVYPKGGRVVQLPNYPWQRKRYWLERPSPAEPTHEPAQPKVPSNWFYEVIWEEKLRTEDPSASSFSAVGSWLIFADTGQLAATIADWLERNGGECVVVRAGDHFDCSDPSRQSINLDDPDDYRRLLETKKSWRGVLHAWSLDAVLKDDLGDLERAERLGCRSLLFLIQALVAAKNPEPPKLWILTRGAQPAWERGGFDSIGQAPAWGFGRTFALEHPEFWGGIIDLDPDSDPGVLAKHISLEMCYPDGESQIALSGKSRRAPRLVASQPPSTTPLTVKTDALYLITGGLGGIGPKIARWLVDKGARHLVLCGRRKLPDRSTWQELAPSHEWYGKIAAIQALERKGASIAVETVDVGDPMQMDALFERLRRSPIPLCGIIHAAADIRLCPLQEMNANGLHATMQAKVEGSWLLHKLSDGLPLDFFVFFSSIAGLFGASHLGHYAASNQFLDSLAHSRRAQGLPGVSINWGAWDEIRFLDNNHDEMLRYGIKIMPGDLALQAMSFLIADSSPQRVVADVDWDFFGEALATRGGSKLFERLRAKRTVATENRDWIESLERVEAEDRRNLVAARVAKETRYILGLTTDDQLDPHRGFFELGMDSLMSVQLKARLEQAVGRLLPATLTFTYPTVHTLTDFIVNQLLNLSGTGEVEAPLRFEGTEAEPDDALADLSEEDIKDLLSAELSSISGDLRS